MLVMKRFDFAGRTLFAVPTRTPAHSIDETETRLVSEVRAEFAANGWVAKPQGSSE